MTSVEALGVCHQLLGRLLNHRTPNPHQDLAVVVLAPLYSDFQMNKSQ